MSTRTKLSKELSHPFYLQQSKIAYSHQVHTLSNEFPGSLGQYNPPGFNFKNLYGCTININGPSSNSSVTSIKESVSEVEIENMIANIEEPIVDWLYYVMVLVYSYFSYNIYCISYVKQVYLVIHKMTRKSYTGGSQISPYSTLSLKKVNIAHIDWLLPRKQGWVVNM